MSVGFGISPNGKWSSVDGSDSGGFCSDALQEYLLDYFTVDGIPVDPYDGGKFSGAQLDTLARQLESAVAEVGAQQPDWPFYDDQKIAKYYAVCRVYGIEPLPPREQAIRELRQAICLAVKARKQNAFLVFYGD